ncbi:hypothetical protein ACFX13_047568 [Malus domestica]
MVPFELSICACMKKDHRDGCAIVTARQNNSKPEYSSPPFSALNGNAKIWEDDQDGYSAGSDMDELLAVLGYKVWSNDMADVAEKLEQLEMSMLSELNTGDDTPSIDDPLLLFPAESSSITSMSFSNSQWNRVLSHDSEYDLTFIPGLAAYRPVYSSSDTESTRKRLKTSIGSSSGAKLISFPTPPRVLVDSQETGVHTHGLCRGCPAGKFEACRRACEARWCRGEKGGGSEGPPPPRTTTAPFSQLTTTTAQVTYGEKNQSSSPFSNFLGLILEANDALKSLLQ